MVMLYWESTVISSMPPGALTRTGLLTNPKRTPAQAAAQAEDPEACVSPAPRSQIRIEMVLGPIGTASWTLVRLGKIVWFSSSGPISSKSAPSGYFPGLSPSFTPRETPTATARTRAESLSGPRLVAAPVAIPVLSGPGDSWLVAWTDRAARPAFATGSRPSPPPRSTRSSTS